MYNTSTAATAWDSGSSGSIIFIIVIIFDGQLTLEADFPVAVGVENVYDPLNEGVLLELRQGHEFINAQTSAVIEVELAEAFPQSFDLIVIESGAHLHRRRILVSLEIAKKKHLVLMSIDSTRLFEI